MSEEEVRGRDGWRARLDRSAREAVGDVRHAALAFRGDAFVPPPADRLLQRVLFGLRIPFQLVRLQLRDPERRRRHLRGTLPGALLTLAVGLYIGVEGTLQEELPSRPRDVRVVRSLELAERSRERLDDRLDELHERAEGLTDDAARAAAAEGIARLEQELARLEAQMEALRAIEELPDAPVLSVPAVPGEEPLPAEVEERPKFEVRSAWLRFFAILSAVYGTLRVVEWCVLALFRDYQDQLSRQLSLLTAVPPDDPEQRPRVRLNFRWLWKRIKRWIRGFVLISIGFVTAVPLQLIPVFGEGLYTVVVTGWTIHWLAVFALAKTCLAWEYGEGVPPWFMRGERVALLRWFAPRWWSRVVGRLSRSVWPAVASFERAPFEAIGLALARTVLYVPVVYSLLRPVYVVAAQHVVLARPPPSPPEREEPPDSDPEPDEDDASPSNLLPASEAVLSPDG